jgi:hypothetical protein
MQVCQNVAAALVQSATGVTASELRIISLGQKGTTPSSMMHALVVQLAGVLMSSSAFMGGAELALRSPFLARTLVLRYKLLHLIPVAEGMPFGWSAKDVASADPSSSRDAQKADASALCGMVRSMVWKKVGAMLATSACSILQELSPISQILLTVFVCLPNTGSHLHESFTMTQRPRQGPVESLLSYAGMS